MTRSTRTSRTLFLVFLSLIFISPILFGQTAPTLGTTATYGAFTSVGAINNTGLTQLVGDIGTNAGNFTGFPPGVYSGAKHVADPQSLTAKNDLTIAWNQMGSIPCDATLAVTMGNGQVLTPQTYCVGPASTITGNLTLDAQGNPNAIFIIKVGGALNVAATSNIILTNLAQAANVYWRIDGAVSILDNSIFKGTIIANGAIHLYGGTTLEGRALSIVGAITMASNMITVPVSAPPGSLTVVSPAAGDTLIGGTQNYQIEFIGINVTLRKMLEYSLDGGATWKLIGEIRNDSSSYSWNVPEMASTQALIRITDSNGVSGTSGMFTITMGSESSLMVVSPAAGDTLIGGTRGYQIEFIGVNVTQQKTLEYSLDSGATWNNINEISNTASTYSWDVPETPSTRALIRITDSNGVSGTSGMFTIKMPSVGDGSINSLTLGGVVNNFIGNNMPMEISWTYTPDIGTSVDVEYSLDGTNSWTRIATVPTNQPQSVMWTTPSSGTYDAAFIRVTSTLGMQRMSEMFRIGSPVAAAPDGDLSGGYSITNFPNPLSSGTTIRFELPVRSFVKISIADALGREVGTVAWRAFEAGSHTIPFDASELAGGVYSYILEVGRTRVTGMMTIVK